MGHMSYEESKKLALKLIIFLAIVTIVEVFISLLGKGHITPSITFPTKLIGFIMIVFSLIKAYYIIGEFMHLKHEKSGMGKTVLIPFVLLIWGVIAFMAEGSSWLKNKNEMATDSAVYEQKLSKKHHAQELHEDKQTKKHGRKPESHEGNSH